MSLSASSKKDFFLRLDQVDRISLWPFVTPLESAPRLGSLLRLKHFFLKRDDLQGIGLGGNKVRKLEYEFAKALREKSDFIITVGGSQSNHARLTAAVAAKLGLKAKLVLEKPNSNSGGGNLLLDSLFGAEIRFVNGDEGNEALQNEMENWAQELTAKGYRPYCLPLGGSTVLGTLGYVRGMYEISQQLGEDNPQIIVGVGSCGTLAGVALGCSLFLPQARVIGISVSRQFQDISQRTNELVRGASPLLQLSLMPTPSFEVYDDYAGLYGQATELGKNAMTLAAQTEGIVVDPIYTAKALAGLIDLAKTNRLDPNRATIFIHTGGSPIFFSKHC